MNMKLSITDLSKKELLELFRNKGFSFSINEGDIKRVRWNTLTHKGQQMMDEACVEIKKYHGPRNYPKYKALMDKFDRGMAILDKAEKFITSGST